MPKDINKAKAEIGKILQETYHKIGGRVEATARILIFISACEAEATEYWKERHFNDVMSAKKSGYDEGKAEQAPLLEALQVIMHLSLTEQTDLASKIYKITEKVLINTASQTTTTSLLVEHDKKIRKAERKRIKDIIDSHLQELSKELTEDSP